MSQLIIANITWHIMCQLIFVVSCAPVVGNISCRIMCQVIIGSPGG